MDSELTVDTTLKKQVRDFPILVIVIPTLNEAESIGDVLDEISEELHNIEYSILVVDGHSVDGTPEIAVKKGAVVIDQHSEGYGDALQTGLMFWFIRKRLFGSYFFLTCTRRSQTSCVYASLTRSSPSSLRKFT